MNQPRKTLLIDSSGVLHRCFHGYPARSGTINDQEMEVAALYGYVSYTCRLLEEFEFDRIVHVLDHEEGSRYRYELYPEYKANRSPTDPRLTQQKELLPQLLEAIGQPYLSVEGVEADDLLATLARKAREEGDHVLIISSDKDLLQLVSDEGVSIARYVQNTDKTGKLHDLYNEASVRKLLGVHPSQVADYLAIVGDTVDNIPGVVGAGPKTAAAWLQEHGNLATLITNAENLKGRGAKELRACLDKLPLYQSLTTALYEVEGCDFPAEMERDHELCLSALTILGAPHEWAERLGFSNPNSYTMRGPRF